MNSHRRIPVYSIYGDNSHTPLALGMIVAFAKKYKGGVLNDVYEFIPRPPTSLGLLRETVGAYGAGIFLCSNYLWSSEHNLNFAKRVKALNPASITVHGGPSVPKYDYSCQSFFEIHPYVDIAVRGEGELTAAELLEQLATHALDSAQTDRRYLSAVRGITYRSGVNGDGADIVRTEDRPSVQDLNSFPSPYLTEEFRRGDAERWIAAIIETNRGCPYGCTFCDWGSATNSKIRQFAIERIEDEIEWIAKCRVGILWIADANFGIFSRDVRIAEAIAACRRKYGYPKQITLNYAKNATERLAEIVRILYSSGVDVQGIVAMQTRDPETLKVIDRSNIKTERYEDLIEIFKRHNLPISSDVMIGLPGSTVESLKADLQFFFDRKVHVRAFSTNLLPNSPMAHRDYIEKYQIETDSSGELVSSYSYTRSDKRTMERLNCIYERMTGSFPVLKYLLYYLQVEHHVKALAFLEALQNQMDLNPTSLPETCALLNGGGLNSKGSYEWVLFYDEIARFVAGRYGIVDRAMKTVLSVQAKVMPATDRRLPEKLGMDYDFVAYFDVIKDARNIENFEDVPPKRLAEYGPGTLEISDPRGLCSMYLRTDKTPYDSFFDWELDSALRTFEGARHVLESNWEELEGPRPLLESKAMSRNRLMVHLRYWILRNKSHFRILLPFFRRVRRMYELTQ